MTTTPADTTGAFRLGQNELDLEHQGQIDLLLDIERELAGAGDKAQLVTLLDRLVEFTNLHFMSEQLLMRQQAYPGFTAHEAEHDQLMDQMRDYQKRVDSGERALEATDLAALRDWVIRHIRTQDAAFAQYCAGAPSDAHAGE